MAQTTFNEKSSHTADGVAYRRTLTAIPRSREIWEILTRLQGPPPAEEMERMKNRALLPYFEARYLMTDRVLRRSGIRQVYELASGLSPRGLNLTEENPSMVYVEIDLPEKMALKKNVVAELAPRPRANLHLEAGNVIDAADFERGARHFDLSQPVAVICEGLLRYIGFDDKEKLARHISGLVRQGGGIWITPDVAFTSEFENMTPERRAHAEHLMKISGMSVLPNLFRDEAHAQSFFEGFGFAVAKHPLEEIADELVCPRAAGLSREQVAESLRRRCTYVMS